LCDGRPARRLAIHAQIPAGDCFFHSADRRGGRQAVLHRSGPQPGEDPRAALLAPLLDVRVDTLDYSYTLRTDHAGFPNRDPWPAQVDVAVLGNSLITGAGVGYEGQFTTLLQRESGSPAVLNFGIPGGGTAHQLLAYRKFVAPLQPKVETVISANSGPWREDIRGLIAR
jgi:hypothetical protein